MGILLRSISSTGAFLFFTLTLSCLAQFSLNLPGHILAPITVFSSVWTTLATYNG